MGQKTITVYKVCDRCPKEQIAEHVDRFSLNGHKFEIDLCERHSAELYAAIMKWADSGRKIGEPSRWDVAPQPKTTVIPSRPATKNDEPVIPPREELPKTAERWSFSDHALERMKERGFDTYEVLMAAERPETCQDSYKNDGTQIRKRGRCMAVVDPHDHTVLTVTIAGRGTYDADLILAQKGA